ncbi:MAG: GNAT family N-acetyltransferase [Coriobacteriales bacterium]|nr:GNAT family N-acetyltransferase [Coriobacteriales bacterium]
MTDEGQDNTSSKEQSPLDEVSHVTLRVMSIDDYEEVYAIWEHIHGFALRSIDDSHDYIQRFLLRNPCTSCVALVENKIVGSILCGHDGRQGSFYHVCVLPEYRQHGIGKKMVKFCLQALNKEGISKATLVAFDNNKVGNKFWQSIGWTQREDFNSYEFLLNKENITRYVI